MFASIGSALLLLSGLACAFAACVLVILALVPPGDVRVAVDDEKILRKRQERAKDAPMIELLMPAVDVLARRFLKDGMDPVKRAELQARLARADHPWGFVPEEFVALQWVAAVGVGLAAWGFTILLGSLVPVLGLVAGAGAFVLTDSLVSGKIRERQFRTSIRIPYALDLLTLTMEAGATFVGAVEQIVRDDPEAYFVRDLAVLLSEIRLGTARKDALMSLGDRVGIDWFQSVVRAIIQGEELGVPVAQILRQQSDLIRVKRAQMAEKLGEEAPVKMVLPTMLVMISVLILFLGPAAVRLAQGGPPS